MQDYYDPDGTLINPEEMLKLWEANGIKKGEKVAIILSPLIFAIEHIFLLFSGAELIGTLLQIASAIALGYLFVAIFYKSGSIIPCILTHMSINSLSVFSVAKENAIYLAFTSITLIATAYATYIFLK